MNRADALHLDRRNPELRKQLALAGGLQLPQTFSIDRTTFVGQSAITLTLPWPPPLNATYRAVRGRTILSAKARAFKARTETLAFGAKPLAGPVGVSLVTYRPSKRSDIDAPIKLVLDALEGVAYANDSQVILLSVQRFDDKNAPRVEVSVTPLEVPA